MKKQNNEPDLFSCNDVPESELDPELRTDDQLIQNRNEMIKRMSRSLKTITKQNHDNSETIQ